MKLKYIKIDKAETCGHLLDDLEVFFRGSLDQYDIFDPLCLIGPNGTGKSQFLQVIAEIFQLVMHACVPKEERRSGNDALEFVLEYDIRPDPDKAPARVRLSRQVEGKKRPIKIEKLHDDEWLECPATETATHALLPTRVIGYTSGDNETLSLPFFLSREGYAEEVRDAAKKTGPEKQISDTRLMLIDYQTHLEVLVANLLLGTEDERRALLDIAQLEELHSFRCIIQLEGGEVRNLGGQSGKRGVQLTPELERYVEQLKSCATCYKYEESTRTHTLDFFIDADDQLRSAFRYFWKNQSLHLFDTFHKLSMLNDLAIPKKARQRFNKDIKNRKFAARLPAPQDEDKVFRFEEVRFKPKKGETVDYVSLSDGEHQFAQLLGMLCMASMPNVLFLLDEPESHFNPQWRVRFISKLLDLPTQNGKRRDKGQPVCEQDLLLTTHAPFVPSDMQREKVLIFKKNNDQSDARIETDNPNIETYGSTFDTIIENCFNIRPPISKESGGELKRLRKNGTVEEIEEALPRIGDSVDKAYLLDRLRQLRGARGA